MVRLKLAATLAAVAVLIALYPIQRARYMPLEPIAPLSDDPTVSLPAIAS